MPMAMQAKVKLTPTLGLRRYYLFFQPPTVNKKTMKTTQPITKFLLTILLIAFVVSCKAQYVLSELSDGQTAKGTNQWYKVKYEGKLIVIENTQNKFANVKQNSPNLPINLRPSKFDITLDKVQLTKICSQYIDIQQLETMLTGNKYNGINIDIRTDLTGKILEVGFYTEKKITF